MSSQQSETKQAESVETFKCIPCKLEFASKKALNLHLTKSSVHKELKLDCDGCSKKFTCVGRLIAHQKTCKELKKQSFQSLTVELEEQKQAFEDDILTLTEEFNEQLEEQKQFHEEQKQSYEQQLLALKDDLNKQKEETKKLKTILEYRESQPVQCVNNYFIQQNNTVVNCQNVVNRLPKVKDSELKMLLVNAPYESLDSHESLGRYFSRNYLSARVVKTDEARNVLVYKDENLNVVRDFGGKEISKKISQLGRENRDEIDKTIKSYKDRVDAQYNNYNRKDETRMYLVSVDNKFCKKLGKTISTHANSLTNLTSLPEIKTQNFEVALTKFFDDFEPSEQLDLEEFLMYFITEFGKIDLEQTQTQNLIIGQYVSLLLNHTIMFFPFDKSINILDDAENVHVDLGSKVISKKLQTFLKDNMFHNAERTNKYHHFCFSDEDIMLISREQDFTKYLNIILQRVFGYY